MTNHTERGLIARWLERAWSVALIPAASMALLAFALASAAPVSARLIAAAIYFAMAFVMFGGLLALARWARKK